MVVGDVRHCESGIRLLAPRVCLGPYVWLRASGLREWIPSSPHAAEVGPTVEPSIFHFFGSGGGGGGWGGARGWGLGLRVYRGACFLYLAPVAKKMVHLYS